VIASDPTDARAFSDLADAFLAGSSAEDRARGAAALLVLINLEPENASAYRRLITAYIEAGDWTDARSALDAYRAFSDADEPDIPFFDGLIALRGDGDEDKAVRHFDRFLELAPHDPRAAMVLSLRERAAGSE
jgi:tetratricopeptide (TPR) repeat protein